MYDEVWKWCQWLRPTEDINMDYKDHPKGKMPICRKLFHGPVTGEEGGKGRDEMLVWDCQKGDNDPTCRLCEIIDSVPRTNEQWFKQYSTLTESLEAYNSRMEWHSRCGSYLRFESDDENPAGTSSTEYSEKIGHVRLGNAVTESDKRGHINFKGNNGIMSGNDGAGTIDIHAEHEAVAFASESSGARVSVVNNKDTSVTFAVESIYFDKTAYIRIMKDGQIIISTPYKVTTESTGNEILIKASTVITENAPIVHVTGNMQIDGTCTHGTCSCEAEAEPGGSVVVVQDVPANTPQTTAHGVTDSFGTPCTPCSVKGICTDGGTCTITGCDETNIYYTVDLESDCTLVCGAAVDGWACYGGWKPCT
jgi:hypothetical protein